MGTGVGTEDVFGVTGTCTPAGTGAVPGAWDSLKR